MTARIGLALAQGCVRAVMMRGERVLWVGEAEFTEDGESEATVARLLSAAPRLGVRRPRVFVAIGPAFAQVRVISGLPQMGDADALSAIVRQNPCRFFLRASSGLLTSSIHRTQSGSNIAAAFEEARVQSLIRGCAAARYQVKVVAPTVAVLRHVIEGTEFAWRDGDILAHVMVVDGSVQAVRRRIPEDDTESVMIGEPKAVLAQLGEHARHFADAAGAAMMNENEELVLRPEVDIERRAAVPRWRLAVACVVFALVCTAAMFGPGLAATRVTERAEKRIKALGEARGATVTARAQLQLFTAALEKIGEFDKKRRSMTFLLSELTRALPERSAILSLHADSTGGTVVALTPDAAGLVSSLERIPWLTNSEIIGPVTSETSGGDALERITLRFHYSEHDARINGRPKP